MSLSDREGDVRRRLFRGVEVELRNVPVVTEVEPAKDFWQAEDYHQQYLVKRGRASCLI